MPPISTPNAPNPGPIRTPAYLKWLLNERAALAGEVQKAKAVVDALQGMRAQLEQRVTALVNQEAQVRLCAEKHQTALTAMDITIAIESPLVNPEAGGVVSAQAGKYGPHGGLKRHVLQLLESVHLLGLGAV